MTCNCRVGNTARRPAWWLRWVLLCSVFAATHGLLGALVVPAVAAGPVVEICTPNGLQWVALGDAQGGEPPANSPHGMAQPCVWAMAHVAVPPGFGGPVGHGVPAWQAAGGLAFNLDAQAHLPSNAARVLLMAPMRAPPA
ncbi:MAG: hypothetical protein Q8S32_03570 [Burkholderiaceae bacterium]|nr:hypothetical protein [Burkholderiaceae bacterium]